MQTLSDIPELVKCFRYNPQPRPQSKSALHICQLVMELMEVTACPIAFRASKNAWQFLPKHFHLSHCLAIVLQCILRCPLSHGMPHRVRL